MNNELSFINIKYFVELGIKSFCILNYKNELILYNDNIEKYRICFKSRIKYIHQLIQKEIELIFIIYDNNCLYIYKIIDFFKLEMIQNSKIQNETRIENKKFNNIKHQENYVMISSDNLINLYQLDQEQKLKFIKSQISKNDPKIKVLQMQKKDQQITQNMNRDFKIWSNNCGMPIFQIKFPSIITDCIKDSNNNFYTIDYEYNLCILKLHKEKSTHTQSENVFDENQNKLMTGIYKFDLTILENKIGQVKQNLLNKFCKIEDNLQQINQNNILKYINIYNLSLYEYEMKREINSLANKQIIQNEKGIIKKIYQYNFKLIVDL